jgi:hypothetical protein
MGKISSHMQAISSNYVLLNVLKAVEKDAEVIEVNLKLLKCERE